MRPAIASGLICVGALGINRPRQRYEERITDAIRALDDSVTRADRHRSPGRLRLSTALIRCSAPSPTALRASSLCSRRRQQCVQSHRDYTGTGVTAKRGAAQLHFPPRLPGERHFPRSGVIAWTSQRYRSQPPWAIRNHRPESRGRWPTDSRWG